MPLSYPDTLIQKGEQLFVFDLQHVMENNERKVWGRAQCPEVDREKEVVLKAAMEAALQDFMALPIMHYNHSERPVGWFTKAYFEGQELYVEGRIKNTPDTNDVWEDIVKGRLAQWSIFGRRIQGSPECQVPPHQRISPCITKALHLYSISICPRNTAINPRTFAQVMKALTSSDTSLIHPTTDEKFRRRDTMPLPNDPTAAGPQPPLGDTVVAPSPAAAPGQTGSLGSTEELLQQLVQKLSNLETLVGGGASGQTVQKCPVCSKEKEKDKTMTKADGTPEATPAQDNIQKADDLMVKASEAMTKAADLITKAETRLAAVEQENTVLKGRLDKIDEVLKSTARPPNLLVLDPKAAAEAAKAAPGGTIVKSAGSNNIRNFDQVFSREGQ